MKLANFPAIGNCNSGVNGFKRSRIQRQTRLPKTEIDYFSGKEKKILILFIKTKHPLLQYLLKKLGKIGLAGHPFFLYFFLCLQKQSQSCGQTIEKSAEQISFCVTRGKRKKRFSILLGPAVELLDKSLASCWCSFVSFM